MISCKSSIISNLPAIILHTPNPLNHIACDVTLSIASSTAEKNIFTIFPFGPMLLMPDPNTKQNTTKPRVFGALRNANCRTKCKLVALVALTSTSVLYTV